VAVDHHAVLGQHEVGLDEVGALLDGRLVGFEGVLRQDARGAAVGDHQRLGAGQGLEAGLSSLPPQACRKAADSTMARVLIFMGRVP
jgi:hypothetical protein